MKNRSIHVFSMLLLLASIGLQAQEQLLPLNEPNYNKTRLFKSLPDRILVSPDQLLQLVSTPSGQAAKIAFGEGQPGELNGEVISQVSKFDQAIQSVVIRCVGFDGARLTLSKITLPDGSIKYSGRIISLQHGDLYQLSEEASGWSLVKRNFYDLINE